MTDRDACTDDGLDVRTGAARRKPRIVRGVAKRHDVATAGGKVSQWWTSGPYAAHVVRWAGIGPGTRVLDLGAGVGSLSLACLGVGANVTAVEIDPDLEPELRRNIGARAKVVIADAFDPHLVARLSMRERFDVAVLNPPWEHDLEVRFLERATQLARRAIGIVSLDAFASARRFEIVARLRQTRELRSPSRLSFARHGRAGQEYPVAVECVARVVPRQLGEEDLVRVSYYVPPRRA